MYRHKIIDVPVFPGRPVRLGHAATTFGKSCITDFSIEDQELAACGFDRSGRVRRGGSGDPLISLAVIVSTNVKQFVRFPAVPADNLEVAGSGRPFLVEGPGAVDTAGLGKPASFVRSLRALSAALRGTPDSFLKK